MREYLRAVSTVLGASIQANPGVSLVLLALTAIQALAVPLLAVAAGSLVDAAVAAEEGRALAWGLALAGCVGARWLVGGAVAHVTVRLQREVAYRLDCRLIVEDSRLSGLEHHECADYLAQLDLLRNEHWRLGFALGAALDGLSLAVQWGATMAILIRLQPALVALPLCGLPSLALAARAQGLMQEASEEVVEDVRREAHLFDLGISAVAGKEMRVFGLGEVLAQRHREAAGTVIRARYRAWRTGALLQVVGQVVMTAGTLGAVILVTARALAGTATPGDIVVVVGLAGQVGGLVGASADTLTDVLAILRVVGRIHWLEGYGTRQRSYRDDVVAVAPDRLREGIDLQGVSFRYPGQEADVLHGVTLHLPAGTTVAIVGENGAGKSTLVKLLCRFYRPTAGKILVDGVDLETIDTGAWRGRLAGAFQDYVRFELMARESVGVGDTGALERGGDGDVLTALERAGATDVLAALPRGLATLLGAGWEGGVDLSGGQWQKVALGRGRMRRHPLVLVLDEPTAALDPGAEHALLTRFAGAARDVREHGGLTLLISHRFSTVQMADLIVVLDGQRVREAGTHAELMGRQDLYAELYALQARAYATQNRRQD